MVLGLNLEGYKLPEEDLLHNFSSKYLIASDSVHSYSSF